MIRSLFFAASLALVGAGCRQESTETPDPQPVATSTDSGEPGIHEATGLVMADGWEFVATHCVSCHSARQFLLQRGTAQTWQTTIDWMQATQGLWEFPEGVEEKIVDYLATNYGPGEAYRRAPLPHHLMPPNPYAEPIAVKAK